MAGNRISFWFFSSPSIQFIIAAVANISAVTDRKMYGGGNGQFDGNAAFSGGGFMPSQAIQTADPSFSPAKVFLIYFFFL